MMIRRLSNENVECIQNASVLFWNKEIKREDAFTFLEDANLACYAAYSNESLVGFAFGYTLKMFASKAKLFIYSVDVLATEQQKGYGKSLILRMLEDAKNAGLEEAFVITNAKNSNANKLYQSIGGIRALEDECMYEWQL